MILQALLAFLGALGGSAIQNRSILVLGSCICVYFDISLRHAGKDMGAVVQTQNNNPADVEESKKAAFGLPFPVLRQYVYRTNTHIIMLNSITYLEISCSYNRSDLVIFSGHCSDRGATRFVTYRCRRYFFSYDDIENIFYLTNNSGTIVGVLNDDTFKFYVSHAPEIGLNLIWGLLAQLNIYPVNSL